VEGAEPLAHALGIDRSRPLWVCGSTGPGEEVVILDAYERLLRDWRTLARGVQTSSAEGTDAAGPSLAIVPRKPERFDEVARLIEHAGFACVRRSKHDDAGPIKVCPERAVWLGDTMGELRKFYSLADVVFVGRTLVPFGGSDPMEVAAMGKPTVVGPHTDNFGLPVRALIDADAARRVGSAEDLPPVIGAILTDRALSERLGSRAREVVIRNQGATTRTVDRIARFLEADSRQT
jgi:3-deoxy-D-manno-octulosonic-acid transferase